MMTKDAAAVVTVTHQDGISRLSLNRPDCLNAVSADMVESLIQGLDAAIESKSHLVVLTGEGRAFSAGFDLSGLDQQSDADLLYRFVRVEQLLQKLYRLPVSSLALVQGRCFGAAADMVAACRHRIGTHDCSFRMPGLQFGIVLGTRRLTALIGADAAFDLLETSRVFSAETALRTRFLTALHDVEDWPELIKRLGREAASLSPESKAALMAQTHDSAGLDADLAALVRSAASPGLADRIRRFVATQVKK